MSFGLVDDAQATMFNVAGIFYWALRKCKVPERPEHPVYSLLSDFLVRCVLSPSVRTRISNAETSFLLAMWLGGNIQWPTTFAGAYNFLRNWRNFMHQFSSKDNVTWLWQRGFIFFGTARTVLHAFTQLKMNNRQYDKHMIIAAARPFFGKKEEVRSTRHLSYYFYSHGDVSHLSTKFLPLYSMMPVACADPLTNQCYSRVRQRIKEETLSN